MENFTDLLTLIAFCLMLDQEQEMLDEEAANQQRLCAITIIDLNNKEINLKVSLEPLTSNPRA